MPAAFGQLVALACADEVVFARSWQGHVARLDVGDERRAFSALPNVPGRSTGTNLWVDREGEVLFTTARGGIARWSGQAWAVVEAPVGPAYASQILSFDGEHAWVPGRGRVVTWGDGQYEAHDPGTWRDVGAIWATAANDVWLGGSRGTVTHFDGAMVRAHPIEAEGAVTHLWGTSARNVWAVLERPTGVHHWDGDAWTARTGDLAEVRVTSIAGEAAEVLVTGDFGIARWGGDGWVYLHRVEPSPYGLPRFQSVCLTRDHIVVGEIDGGAWLRPRRPPAPRLERRDPRTEPTAAASAARPRVLEAAGGMSLFGATFKGPRGGRCGPPCRFP